VSVPSFIDAHIQADQRCARHGEREHGQQRARPAKQAPANWLNGEYVSGVFVASSSGGLTGNLESGARKSLGFSD
jgi:hypothetical protein